MPKTPMKPKAKKGKKSENPTRKELLAMPERKDENLNRFYKFLYIIPAGTKHESGWMHIAIIGVWEEKGKLKYEICSYPDDINWLTPNSNRGDYERAHLRTDCLYPQGVLKFWGGEFQVGWGSSTKVRFIPEK